LTEVLPDRPEMVAARRVVDAAGNRPLNSRESWQVGDLLVSLLGGAAPTDVGLDRKKRELLLSQLSPLIGLTAGRLRDYWRFAHMFPPELRVPNKTWNEHRIAVFTASGGRRNQYNVGLALRLLRGESEAQEEVDPFSAKGLTGQQLERAKRIWKHQDDFNDPVAVKAVSEELRGQRKKGLNSVASAAHALTQQKLKEMEELAKAGEIDNALQILNRYHTQMLRATDASYQLKLIVESAPAKLKWAVKTMIEGSVIVASRAIEELLDVLDDVNASDEPRMEAGPEQFDAAS